MTTLRILTMLVDTMILIIYNTLGTKQDSTLVAKENDPLQGK